MKKYNNKSGFTLIEIIVVLIIIGILAAIALPNLFTNVQTSQGSSMLQTADGMKTPIETCMAKNNVLPGAGACSFATIFTNGISADEVSTGVTGFEIVLDSSAGTPSANTAAYVLLGENAGTEAFDLSRATTGVFSCTAGAAPYNNVC